MISFNLIEFDKIDSTSTFLKENYEKFDNFTLVFAKEQTNGHGRMKRKWHSNYGDAILFSLLIKDEYIFKRFSDLSLISAVTVYKFLSRYTKNLSIKWPNDVYLNGKKISGMLLEGISIGEKNIIIDGIGININQNTFDDEIKNKATSLFIETHQKYNIEELKKALLEDLSWMIEQIKSGSKEYLSICRKNNFLKDRFVRATIDGEIKNCKVIDINDDNSLLVEVDSTFKSLFMGEVLPL